MDPENLEKSIENQRSIDDDKTRNGDQTIEATLLPPIYAERTIDAANLPYTIDIGPSLKAPIETHEYSPKAKIERQKTGAGRSVSIVHVPTLNEQDQEKMLRKEVKKMLWKDLTRQTM